MRETEFIIVRTYGAGVHCGFIDRIEGRLTCLRSARRIWRWRGANTLHELSLKGSDVRGGTRISEPVDYIELTTTIERIPCTAVAAENLQVSRWLD